MIRICATCKLVLGTTDDGNDAVTHGLCEDCAEQLYMRLFPVGTRVTCGEQHGEVVRHLQTRVIVMWDGVYTEDAASAVAASTLYREVVSSSTL